MMNALAGGPALMMAIVLPFAPPARGGHYRNFEAPLAGSTR
jgi:hypothetical protein